MEFSKAKECQMMTELTIINRTISKRSLSLVFSIRHLIRGAFNFIGNSKMRILLIISLFFVSNAAWSQPWQDALKNARESYLVKSYDQAVSHYRTAQKLAPKNVDLSIELAQALYKLGKYDEAEKLYNSQLNKNHSNVSNSDIYRQLGNSRMHQQKYTEAIDSYKNSLRSNPSDEVSRHNLAKAIEKKREKENPKDNPPPKQNQQDPKDQGKEPEVEKDKDKQQQNQKPSDPAPKVREGNENQSLSDKRTERLLEELSNKEKETKRKMNSKVGDKPNSRTGVKKDW